MENIQNLRFHGVFLPDYLLKEIVGLFIKMLINSLRIHGECLVDELSRTKKAIKANAASHIFLIGMERCGANSILEFLGTSIPIKFDSRGRMASRMVFNFFGAHKILEGLEDEIPSLCASR